MARTSTHNLRARARIACDAVGLTDAQLDNEPFHGGWCLVRPGAGSISGDRKGATAMLAFLDGMILAANLMRGRP